MLSKAKILAVAAAFGTLIPVITFFNVPMPIPAWATQVEDLEERQLEKLHDLYQRELFRKRHEKRNLQREMQQYEKEHNEPAPAYYIKDDEYLQNDIEEIEKTIEEAQQRILELKK
jgi:hypothetical protein